MNAVKNRKYRLLLLAVIGFVCILLTSQTKVYAAEDTEMNIYGIYLGNEVKGDSVLLESKGEYLLMDMGQNDSVPYVIDELQKLGVTHLSLYFSHLHMDHNGGKSAYEVTTGIEQLLNAGFTIDRLYLPAESLSKRSLKNPTKYLLLRSYAAGLFPITYLDVGSILIVGDAVGMVIGPLGEELLSLDDYTTYENNCSLATIFTCGKTRFFTSGDSQAQEAALLLEKYGDQLDCDIMKLTHHGSSKGNTRALIAAISPTYSFAENFTNYSKRETSGRWQTYEALTRASDYGVCYLVGNEQKTVIYHVKNDVIQMYQGDTIDTGVQLSGWVQLTGGDGALQTKAMYYIDENNQVLTGIRKIGDFYYNLGTGGRMVFGSYSEDGYSPWLKDKTGQRCYVLSDDGNSAQLQVGFCVVDEVLYHFDEEGYLTLPDSSSKLVFTKINGRRYLMDTDGSIATDQFVEVKGSTYYLNAKGNLVANAKKKIDGDYYIFDESGRMVYSDDELIIYELNDDEYGINIDGSLLTDVMAEIDGDTYYFGKTGVMQKQKKILIDKNYYYFGKSGKMVTDKKVKINGKSYYFGSNGKMYRNRYVRLSNGKKYRCDKNGVMKLVKEA